MSIAEPTAPAELSGPPAPRPAGRSLRKRATHLLRRGHLYLGLFLFPWAVLYGVTAFLFNHPTAFSDQPTASFGKGAIAGTPLADLPSPTEQAERVVARLNAQQKPATAYRLAGEARYGGREFAFATVKADGRTVSVLVDVKNGGGTVRSAPAAERKEPERAPFASASGPRAAPKGGSRGGPRAEAASTTVTLDDPLHERVRAAVPTILERTGFPGGEVTVTSVPDLTFPVEADGRLWTATYSPMTGAVSGVPADARPATELSVRRFLLRLHLSHGYPGETNGKWFWALVVDAMAFTMCFWGLSGLVMWWQLKAARRAGLVMLLLSTAAAAALGFAMHAALTA